ncbi:MAG: tRNA-dihydrouridine synthase family protein [Planctomycetia bacterium]|nr:tRNA-dihydrouridine synthase family protein [Planctomycetia bacterium]
MIDEKETEKTLWIGDIAVTPPLLMAPMAGFTGSICRRLVRELGGCGLPATEMISARGFVSQKIRNPDDDELDRLWKVAEEPRPLAAQIWDNDPEQLALVGERLAHEYRVSVVDINFGCPAPDIAAKAMSGSFLLRDPERIGRLVERVVKACAPTPVTAKIRLGIDATSAPGTCGGIRAYEVAEAVESAGAAALTVHGRFARQMFSGEADWDAIASVKEHLRRIPLIGNGDLDSPEKAADFLRRYPVDGVMIGRAAIGKPWLFRQTAERLRPTTKQRPEFMATPDVATQRQMLLRVLYRTIERYGEEKAVVIMRKYACRWGAGRTGARDFRRNVGSVRTTVEFESLIRRTFDGTGLLKSTEQNPEI